jgi:hypothetical protein
VLDLVGLVKYDLLSYQTSPCRKKISLLLGPWSTWDLIQILWISQNVLVGHVKFDRFRSYQTPLGFCGTRQVRLYLGRIKRHLSLVGHVKYDCISVVSNATFVLFLMLVNTFFSVHGYAFLVDLHSPVDLYTIPFCIPEILKFLQALRSVLTYSLSIL